MPRDDLQPETDRDARDAEESAIALRSREDLRLFAPIYERYYRPVFGYSFQRLRHPELAADATSQTFAQAMGAIGRFHGGSVRRWLFTIAHNVVVDIARAQRHHLDLDAAPVLADPEPGPELSAIAAERSRMLFAALSHLTPNQRHIVELRLAGLTAQEVADVLDTTPGAVKTAQHRAYARLRRLFTEDARFGDLP